MRRIAAYSRVSTHEQPRGLEGQRDALRAYAEARGAELVEFTDRTSGRKAKRPGLTALMDAVHRREIDAVVTTRLDRLARSVRHLAQLAADLEARGVALVVLDQGVDTNTSAGRLMFNVLASIAEFEADLVRERTRDALAAARRRGRHPGRPRAIAPELLARAKRMRKAGRSVRGIAATLGVARSTLARELAA